MIHDITLFFHDTQGDQLSIREYPQKSQKKPITPIPKIKIPKKVDMKMKRKKSYISIKRPEEHYESLISSTYFISEKNIFITKKKNNNVKIESYIGIDFKTYSL